MLFISTRAIIKKKRQCLVHGLNELVDVLLTVAGVTANDEVAAELAVPPHVVGGGELEGPQEVVGLLEVGADGVDLVDQVLNALDAVLAKSSLNDRVVVEGNALAVNLGVTALVDELADGLQVGVAIGDIGLDKLKHLQGSLVQTNEDTVVDLEKTEELHDLAGLGGDVVDTADTDNEHKLGLGRNVVVTLSASLAGSLDLGALGISVLGVVLGGALLDLLALGLGSLVDKKYKLAVVHK